MDGRERMGEGHDTVADLRHDWTLDEVEALFALPFTDLLLRAQAVHRRHFPPNQVQISTLLSIKTGACPEDCAYCPQSVRYDTGLEREALMEVESVVDAARLALAQASELEPDYADPQCFLAIIEFQFLGGREDGAPRPTAAMCSPGTEVDISGSRAADHCVPAAAPTVLPSSASAVAWAR